MPATELGQTFIGLPGSRQLRHAETGRRCASTGTAACGDSTACTRGPDACHRGSTRRTAASGLPCADCDASEKSQGHGARTESATATKTGRRANVVRTATEWATFARNREGQNRSYAADETTQHRARLREGSGSGLPHGR